VPRGDGGGSGCGGGLHLVAASGGGGGGDRGAEREGTGKERRGCREARGDGGQRIWIRFPAPLSPKP
jgi:hypothetical protein